MQTQSPKHWIRTLTLPESSFHAITFAPIAWLVGRSVVRSVATLFCGGVFISNKNSIVGPYPPYEIYERGNALSHYGGNLQ